jgi:transposase
VRQHRAPHLCRAAASDDRIANQEIADADRELAAAAKADPIARRLMTVPRVGPARCPVRRGPGRDPSIPWIARGRVVSRARARRGPSAERQHRTSITKAGPTALRRCLVQAAWAARRTRWKDPMHRWADAIEKRRGTLVAALVLARKLAGILFAIWRDGTVNTSRGRSHARSSAKPRLESQYYPGRIRLLDVICAAFISAFAHPSRAYRQAGSGTPWENADPGARIFCRLRPVVGMRGDFTYDSPRRHRQGHREKKLLIAGANRGLGRALVDEALRRGAKRVFPGSRGPLRFVDDRVISR